MPLNSDYCFLHIANITRNIGNVIGKTTGKTSVIDMRTIRSNSTP